MSKKSSYCYKPRPYEPCWCGSGLPYKKCCMHADIEAESSNVESFWADLSIKAHAAPRR